MSNFWPDLAASTARFTVAGRADGVTAGEHAGHAGTAAQWDRRSWRPAAGHAALAEIGRVDGMADGHHDIVD
jgi:hypothetical protein